MKKLKYIINSIKYASSPVLCGIVVIFAFLIVVSFARDKNSEKYPNREYISDVVKTYSVDNVTVSNEIKSHIVHLDVWGSTLKVILDKDITSSLYSDIDFTEIEYIEISSTTPSEFYIYGTEENLTLEMDK